MYFQIFCKYVYNIKGTKKKSLLKLRRQFVIKSDISDTSNKLGRSLSSVVKSRNSEPVFKTCGLFVLLAEIRQNTKFENHKNTLTLTLFRTN
jgi:hypothetical protein